MMMIRALAIVILMCLGNAYAAHFDLYRLIEEISAKEVTTVPSDTTPWTALAQVHSQIPFELTPEGGLDCNQCQSVVAQVADMARNNTSLDEMIQVLNTECDTIFADKPADAVVCKTMGKFLVELSPKIIKNLDYLDWTPEAFCATLLSACTIDCCISDAPEQVKLAWWSDISSMGVSWVARENKPSTVTYGIGDMTETVIASVSTYTSGGWKGFVYSAVMTKLQPATKYSYGVGFVDGPRRTFTFTTVPETIGTEKTPLILAQIGDVDYGDAGNGTLSLARDFVFYNSVHGVVHVGDIGYADGYERHSDVFGREIEVITSRVPYMTIPGNHEFWNSFESYKTRFPMPNTCKDNAKLPSQLVRGFSAPVADRKDCRMYYSFDLGPVHFLMLAGESIINTGDFDDAQVAFAKDDLLAAKQRGSKWSIAMNHRPLYCTTNNNVQCTTSAAHLRSRMESTLRDGQVDMVLTGHVHAYERTHPVFDGKVTNQPDVTKPMLNMKQPTLDELLNQAANPYKLENLAGPPPAVNYTNPSAPVHITQSGGNREGQRSSKGDADWSHARFSDPGVGLITITENYINYMFFSSAKFGILDIVNINKK